jgi:ABC-2 type transport system ATP-binding protein
MHQVEELCDRIVLIDEGRDVLYGRLDEIRRRYTGHAVLVRVTGELPAIEGIEEITPHNSAMRLTLGSDVSPQQVLQDLLSKGATLEKFEIALPTLDEIFIRVVDA